MDWQDFRLNTRLNRLDPKAIERIYAFLSEIDAVKHGWSLTKKLSPLTIKRLTKSVIITSTGASNRIEGNRLTDEQVEEIYKTCACKNSKRAMFKRSAAT